MGNVISHMNGHVELYIYPCEELLNIQYYIYLNITLNSEAISSIVSDLWL